MKKKNIQKKEILKSKNAVDVFDGLCDGNVDTCLA